MTRLVSRSLKSAPDKKASSILYRLYFLQVWPFKYCIWTNCCWGKFKLTPVSWESLNKIERNTLKCFNNIKPDLIKKLFSKMAALAKNGVRLDAFLTEVNFSCFSDSTCNGRKPTCYFYTGVQLPAAKYIMYIYYTTCTLYNGYYKVKYILLKISYSSYHKFYS